MTSPNLGSTAEPTRSRWPVSTIAARRLLSQGGTQVHRARHAPGQRDRCRQIRPQSRRQAQPEGERQQEPLLSACRRLLFQIYELKHSCTVCFWCFSGLPARGFLYRCTSCKNVSVHIPDPTVVRKPSGWTQSCVQFVCVFCGNSSKKSTRGQALRTSARTQTALQSRGWRPIRTASLRCLSQLEGGAERWNPTWCFTRNDSQSRNLSKKKCDGSRTITPPARGSCDGSRSRSMMRCIYRGSSRCALFKTPPWIPVRGMDCEKSSI